jgi:hypothetical protein
LYSRPSYPLCHWNFGWNDVCSATLEKLLSTETP